MRRNPFGEPPPEDLPALVVADLDDHFRWWTGPGRRALQWMGPCGHGKSARLAGLRGRDPGVPSVYLAEDEPLPEIPRTPRLILDEAQRLPRFRRWLLFRRVERIAIGTHRDHRGELEAAGLEVRCLSVGELGVGRLGEILERRLAWAELEAGASPRPRDGEVARLHSRYGADLRSLLDHLYETFQRWCAGGLESPWESVERREHGEV